MLKPSERWKLDYIRLRTERKNMDHNDPKNAAVKPAFYSTEFWLSFAAVLVGFLLASGLLSPDDPTQATVIQVLGVISTLLSSLGYTACRTSAKNKAAAGAAMIEVAKQVPPQPSEQK